MRKIFIGLFAVVIWATAAIAQTTQDVIADQLEAFNNRDVPKAFSYASPMIQRLFGNPNNFGGMVAQGYPMVWDNNEVRFLAQRQEGAVIYQRIMLRDQNGGLHLLEYKMVPLDGSWKIDGVALLPPPDTGV